VDVSTTDSAGGAGGGRDPLAGPDPWWRVVAQPTVLILLAAGVVHIIRRNPFDISIFFGTALLIVVDRLRREPTVSTGVAEPLSGRLRLAAAGALALYSVVAGQWETDTWPMRVAMIIPGLLFAVIVAVRTPVEEGSVPRVGRGWIPWAAIAVAIALWELTSFVQQPNPIDDSYQHPTISAIVEPWLESWVGRSVFLMLWVAAGFWLIRTIAAGRSGPRPIDERRSGAVTADRPESGDERVGARPDAGEAG
jgi:hypothetical protein